MDSRTVLCTIVSFDPTLEYRGSDATEVACMSSDYVLVLTTLPNDADGPAFGRGLVEERLAACVNILAPMDSVYRWEGQIEHEIERQVIIKTSRERLNALWDRVRELHPYEIPEFIVLTIADGNDAYLRWVGEGTK
jgi:periplasmic divalent cation tolerance protein